MLKMKRVKCRTCLVLILVHQIEGYISSRSTKYRLLRPRPLWKERLQSSITIQMAVGNGGQSDVPMPPPAINREAPYRSTQSRMRNNSAPRNIRYSDFLSLVDADQIDKVTFRWVDVVFELM